MSFHVNVNDMTPEQRARYEVKRELEFYSYYEPFRASGNGSESIPWTDLNSEEAMAMHEPSSSPDKALTAFCQLAAIRLGMRRAMVFFFDSSFAYVLAEATRTLSLQDDKAHDPADELWLGTTKIPRGFSVCEHTVNLPTNEGTNSGKQDSDIVHIISNLSEDTRFCNRPFVLDGPRARFYAGVPITTEKGLNIGAFKLFSVLDDQVHEGLNSKETAFLQDMGATIMSHLEMVRARSEQRRGARMVKALSVFIEEDSTELVRQQDAAANHVETHDFARQADHDRHKNDLELMLESQKPQDSRLPTPDHTLGRHDLPSGQSSIPEAPNASVPDSDEIKDNITRNTPINALMDSAARLVRAAVDADGVVFIDASLSGFGELSRKNFLPNDRMAGGGETLLSSTDGSETAYSEAESIASAPSQHSSSPDAFCQLLGSSYALRQQRGTPAQNPEIPYSLMQNMVRHHKNGTIWNFDAEGEDAGDDALSTDCSASDGSRTKTMKPKQRKRATKASLGKHLIRLFPGARSLALLGLWDPVQGRWYASCIVWSRSPMRVFSKDSEMNYLTAFCDVIMAKVGRLDMETTYSIKSTFMSSISHELRSPLHGILGTTELLQDQGHSSETRDLIAQIDTCGRMLLDIVDHLLDFSKINVIAKESRHNATEKSDGRRNLSSWMEKRGVSSGIISANADVSLDKLTEEVVEAAVYSHKFSKRATALSSHQVHTILDIEQAPEFPWRARVPVGAWKRLCLNLVNNALKYTTEGYVSVSLKMLAPQGRRAKPIAQMTITDSGCGMAKDFLENSLFSAFKQENSLTEGTGLGMAMVSNIIKAMRGNISVQSKKNVGTTVTVTIPLDMVDQTHDLGINQAKSELNVAGTRVRDCLGSRAGRMSTPISYAQKVQLSTIRKTCRELGLELSRADQAPLDGPTVIIAMKAELPGLLDRLGRSNEHAGSDLTPHRLSALVVICKDHAAMQDVGQHLPPGLMVGHVECVLEPCGPERLRIAIAKCRDHLEGVPRVTKPIEEAAVSPTSRGKLSPKETPMLGSTTFVPSLGSNGAALPFRSIRAENSDLPSPDIGPVAQGQATESLATPTAESLSQPKLAELTIPTTNPDSQITASQPNLPKPRLLLVDDNAINLTLLVTYAKKNKFENYKASDGLEAVNAYKDIVHTSHPPSLEPLVVLMDISMPIMDGFEATRTIRAHERRNHLVPATIIALTGLGSADAQKEAFTSGVDLFLTKPVRLKELTSLLTGIRERSIVVAGEGDTAVSEL